MRLIDADAMKCLMEKRKQFFVDAYGGSFHCMSEKDKARCDEIDACIASIVNAPTVLADAVQAKPGSNEQTDKQSMTKEEAIDRLRDCAWLGSDEDREATEQAVDMAVEALSADAVQVEWIPFTRRPMTEEEKKDYPDCTFMFDCVLPDDGDEILVSNGRFVWMDTFCNDIDGCYLDSNGDIAEDMAWMPLPTPYKGGEDE